MRCESNICGDLMQWLSNHFSYTCMLKLSTVVQFQVFNLNIKHDQDLININCQNHLGIFTVIMFETEDRMECLSNARLCTIIYVPENLSNRDIYRHKN